MAITRYRGSGGKTCRQPQWRVRSSPYDSPSSAAPGMCRPPVANEAGGSGWFKRLIDPAARVIVRSVSRFFSSVFGRDLAATPGENISIIEEVPEVKSSLEIRECGKNSIEIRLSIPYNGNDTAKQELISHIDAIFHLEQLLNQKSFSGVEINQLEELLHSKTIERSTLPLALNKNIEKISEASCIDLSSSQQIVTDEKEKGVNANVSLLHKEICEKGIDSPKGITKTYLASQPRKALQGGRSRLYEMVRSPYWKSSIMKKARSNSPYKGINVEPIGTFKLSESPSTTGHVGHGQALKRGSCDSDTGGFTATRNVRQKTYSMDFCRLTHIDPYPPFYLGKNTNRALM